MTEEQRSADPRPPSTPSPTCSVRGPEGFVYRVAKNAGHKCDPPTVEMSFHREPTAGVGSVWRCSCGQLWVVDVDYNYSPLLYWRRARWRDRRRVRRARREGAVL